MSRFDSAKHPNVQVHDSAYVDEPCEIGAGTKIWHFSHIMAQSRLGKSTNSSGFSVVEAKQPAEPLAAHDLAIGGTDTVA